MVSPKWRLIALAASTVWLVLQPSATLAQGVDLGLVYATGTGLTTLDIREIAVNLIRTALGFVGFIMVLRIMAGGLKMMTHGGSEEARTEAIETIKSGVIGMIIIMTSTALARFVITAVINATSNYL